MQPVAIRLQNVDFRYRVNLQKPRTLKESLLNLLKSQNSYRDLWAVRGLNWEIRRGESWGIIGANGAGKSTLLRMIAGVLPPTQGTCVVDGRVSPLIELGAGFNGELTGRENLFLAGSLMGLTRRAMLARYDRIVEFSGLAEFMDVPVKCYSSGMYARLAFSLATDIDADILLIDEVLSVGDEAFQQRSLARIEQLLHSATTVVFVSHDAEAVRRICQQAIVLKDGACIYQGPCAEALQAYRTNLQAAS